LHDNPVRTQNGDKKALSVKGKQNKNPALISSHELVELVSLVKLLQKVLVCYLYKNVEYHVHYKQDLGSKSLL
jgi:hypothetical protein